MEDTDLLEMLRSAEADGRVTIGLDPRKLDDVDSPISIQAESTRWIYGLMAAALFVWWLGGASAGIGAIAAGPAKVMPSRRQSLRQVPMSLMPWP